METRGERLKRLREARKFSMAQLAELVGVTKANVSKWEKSASPNIDLAVFFKLAETFGVDPEALATGKARKIGLPADIPPHRLSLIRLYGELPAEMRMPIRALIETLSAAHRESYAKWSTDESERVKKRDSKKPTPA